MGDVIYSSDYSELVFCTSRGLSWLEYSVWDDSGNEIACGTVNDADAVDAARDFLDGYCTVVDVLDCLPVELM